MPRGPKHNAKVSSNVEALFEWIIELWKITASQGFPLVPIRWYQWCQYFDIDFVFWVKVLLELLNVRNFFSLDHVLHNCKLICFTSKAMKIDWIWRKVFEIFVTILTVSVDIIEVLPFQLLSTLEKFDSKFKSFFTESLKIPKLHFKTVYGPIYS